MELANTELYSYLVYCTGYKKSSTTVVFESAKNVPTHVFFLTVACPISPAIKLIIFENHKKKITIAGSLVPHFFLFVSKYGHNEFEKIYKSP